MSTNVVSVPSDPQGAPLLHAQHDPQSSHSHEPDHDSSCDDKHDPTTTRDDKATLAPPFLHSPPDSNNAHKTDASDSELSDLEDEPTLDDSSLPNLPATVQDTPQDAPSTPDEQPEDIGEVLPDSWSGAVPIFKPTMHQFKDFQRFMAKVDSYGMKSGIIKIIPPKEWKDAQPPLDDLVKQVRVREPIKQDIMGSNGTYRQVNILHGRSYNVPQWRQLCEKSEHQPPAKRGERRANANQGRPSRARAAATKSNDSPTPQKRTRGRPAKGRGKKGKQEDEERPMTPISPKPETAEPSDEALASIEDDAGACADEPAPAPRRMGGVKPQQPKTQSVSARRKFSRREGSAMIDEEAFKDFDYNMDTTEYTPERCEELERSYWKTLTYAQPLYGADMMGTLFDDRTEIWNLNKLPNILDVLGSKVPGVNTAYLYLGMWKATFAWHLEDVDLYSINYLHFGAPKQWYSISQADAKRFENAMKNIWPADAKACPQFLRHKGFLISPQHLLQHYNIKVNRVVSYPGEFVVTYPYGYHSGYNLGYNCAEAVNFALEPWLEMGKIAKKCECAQAQDSVWIDVHAIERKLRGEETEYEETEDEEDDEDEEMSGLPTPPASHGVKFKDASRKRKRAPGEKAPRVKKIKLRLNAKAEPPCCLCPNDYIGFELLPTEDGRKAHRTCALYIPETYIESEEGKETVYGVTKVHKDRLDLKCLFCRSKRGACFQCSQKKCARAYHASCAAAAGVFVEEQEVPVFGEDGTEYKEQAFEFSCRFHRTKRDKKLDSITLEEDERISTAAAALSVGDMCQLQLYRGEIFAALVVENRADEHMLLLDIVPTGKRVEVEWKWLLLPDPADYHLPKASARAIPLPASQKAKDRLNAKRADDKPRKDDVFGAGLTWAEYNYQEVSNKDQAKVNFEKQDQIWHYLGKTSTDARAQYTEDPSRPRFNPKGNFLDTLPKPPPKPRQTPASYHQHRQTQGGMPFQAGSQAYLGTGAYNTTGTPSDKPYVYKPKFPATGHSQFAAQRFMPPAGVPSPPIPGVPAPAAGQYAKQLYEVNTQNNQPHRSSPTSEQHQLTTKWRVSGHGANPSPTNQNSPVATGSYQHASPTQRAPASRPSWQIHPSIYQRYPFFYSNHSRDSSKYRTPYSPTGGFTNGWEGKLDAHMMSQSGEPWRPSPGPSQETPMTRPDLESQHPTMNSKLGSQGASMIPQTMTWSASQHARPASSGASKPPPPLKQAVLGLANAAALAPPKPAKAAVPMPLKQSPVPLPPNIMAAMRSSNAPVSNPAKVAIPATSAGTAAQPQRQSPGTGGPSASTRPNQASPSHTPGATKVSTSPVPVPTFSVVTPHQHAAQIAESAKLSKPMTTTGRTELQAFPDVPAESMDFVDRLMGNLRRISQHNGA